MSQEYAENRIKEALKQAKGNPTKARQLIIAWTGEDHRLLQALARPHLTGIAAHAINRVIYHQDQEGDPAEIPAKPESLNMAPETFGQEILKVLSDPHAALFGLDAGAPPARPKQASQSHIDALKMLAKAKKKKDGGQ